MEVAPAIPSLDGAAREADLGPEENAAGVQVPEVPGRVSTRSEHVASTEMVEGDVIWVEWAEGDPDNPYNFSKRRKWTITGVCCCLTGMVAWISTSFPVGNSSMMRDLHCSREYAALGLSAFPLGFATAPMILSAIAEEMGRYTMYAIATCLMIVFMIPTALAKNVATVIICRLITGLAASCGSTVVGGTLADLFEAADRGPAMSMFSVATFAGTGLGPGILGYVGQRLGWRYVQYVQIGMSGALWLALVFMTEETRGSVILERRAARMRKSTGDLRYRCRPTSTRKESFARMWATSLARPFYLLFTEPIIAAISLWIGVAWGVLYLSLEAVSLVMSEVYGFSIGQSGLVFLAIPVAAIIGHISNRYQEKLYKKNVGKRGPEARLYAALLGGLLFPGGLFIFAFSQGRGSWAGPVVALVIIFTGIFMIYLGIFNYLADVYTPYASSALSGQSLCRNMAGFAFPLFTFQLYDRLGSQWASFLSGCLGLALAPLPFILMVYGPRIRRSSKFAKRFEEALLVVEKGSV